MNNSKSGRIAFIGIICALTFGFMALETQVLGAVLPVSPCYFSLPLAISLSIFTKRARDMFIGGGIFGLCSFILSFIFGYAWFMNPLISVLPRVIFGIVAYLIYCGISKLTVKSENSFLRNNLPPAVAGVFGAITNTVLVVAGFFIFGWQDLQVALTTILSFNALIEIVCCVIIVPVLVKTERKFYRLDDYIEDDSLTKEKEVR